MRFHLVFLLFVSLMASSAPAQETDSSSRRTPAQDPAAAPAESQVEAAQDTQRSPSDASASIADPALQDASPQDPSGADSAADPNASFNLNDLDASGLQDNLDLDSAQSFDFDESDDFDFTDTSDLQNQVASNQSFDGPSPQMIGDFGGGSTIFTVGGGLGTNSLSSPIPFAGGSRRIKMAENNQVIPLNRVYGTFNYFHNASQIVGTLDDGVVGAVSQVDSDTLLQYTFGFEKTFLDDYFSVEVRMPFTSGVDQISDNPGSLLTPTPTGLAVATGQVGNLQATIKAYLLQAGRTSISSGISVSIPTGTGVEIDSFDGFLTDLIDIDNDAVHLMPFLGVYRTIGDDWWLQGFVQVDTPTSGNDVFSNGVLRGRLTEQTLLYSDFSVGRWLYRNPSNSRARGGRGITSIASLIELHYTGALNDADGFTVESLTDDASVGFVGPGYENRFDVLNLTLGLQTDLGDVWRVNVGGVIPLREGRYDDFGGRREDQFFDGELAIQVNRFF